MKYVRSVIEKELNRKVEDVFLRIDEKPLGAASIGQAHRAILNNATKDEVCIKLQYPEMEKMFRADLSAIRRFVTWLEPGIGEAMAEMESQFLE
ncbi:hypothetical protein RFI_25259, partial [Reticulomyxa filosa]